MKEINIDWIEKTEEGLVKKNPSTKMKLVEGLDATIQGLENQIANAGKVDSVNGQIGEIILKSEDIPHKEGSVNSTLNAIDNSVAGILERINKLQSSKADKKHDHFSRDIVDFEQAVDSKVSKTTNIQPVGSKNPDDLKTSGLYQGNANLKIPNGHSGLCDYFLDVKKNETNGTITQTGIISLDSGGSKRQFVSRMYINAKWTEWQRVDGSNKVDKYTEPSLFKGDMNDLVEMGRYYVADTATNTPASGGWFVDVYVANIQNNQSLHKFQVAYKMTGTKEVYARNQWGGTWTGWQRLDAGNKVSSQELKDLEYSELTSVATKKANGIYEEVEWRKKDGTLYCKTTYKSGFLNVQYNDHSNIVWRIHFDEDGFPYKKEVIS